MTQQKHCFRLADAVGTTITDRPPHKTVRARLCIRLPPRMSGAKAFQRIRMQDSRERNPMIEDLCELIPTQRATLAAATQRRSPQTREALPENPHTIQISGNRMVLGIPHHNLLEPSTGGRHRLMPPVSQLRLNRTQLRHHPLFRRFAPDDEGSIAPALPAVMRKAQEREGFRFSLATLLPVLGGKAPQLDQPRLFRIPFQTELCQPLLESFPEAFGLCPAFEADNQIIGIPHDDHIAACLLLAPSFYPQIEDIMQVDVGNQR